MKYATGKTVSTPTHSKITTIEVKLDSTGQTIKAVCHNPMLLKNGVEVGVLYDEHDNFYCLGVTKQTDFISIIIDFMQKVIDLKAIDIDAGNKKWEHTEKVSIATLKSKLEEFKA